MGAVGQGRWDLVFPSGAPDRIGDMFATAVMADAVRRYDADLAQSVETCRNWACGYRTVFRGTTALAASSAHASLGMAEDGLRSARQMLRFVAGLTVSPLRTVDFAAVAESARLATGRIDGQSEPDRRLAVPYRGALLAEDSLRVALREWVSRGYVEPGFAAAVERVIDHPEWLALPGTRMIVAGAGELSPLRPLLRWGAEVLAIDLPGSRHWQELSELARAGAGVLRYPITRGPGADITRQLPALMHWLRNHTTDARPVFGLYANRSGPQGIRLACAVDLLAEDLLGARPDAALAVVGAPTDCYAVPESVVAQARERAPGGLPGAAARLVRTLTRSALCQPNYHTDVLDERGEHWGIADLLPRAHGPNHALAHRLRRWRTLLAHRAGHPVSYTVAPPTWTRATRAHRSLSALYRGLQPFGVTTFDPDTARTLLAAKLVADLHTPPPIPAPLSANRPAAAPDSPPPAATLPPANPEALFVTGAAHGGLWHLPFEPHSLHPLATPLGYLRTPLHHP